MTKLPVHKGPDAGDVKSILKAALHAMLHNWGFKLLALIIAITLWAGLITQDPTLTREKSFSDVTINVTGSDTMKRNGFIVVSDLDKTLSTAYLRADVPQMQYQDATASTYNVRIDLSRITETGVQQVKVQTTNSATYGTVTEVSPDTVEIEVEEYITRYRIPVTVNTSLSAPDGYYAATPTLDPPLVAVSGPRSLVEQVVRAEATMDLSQLPAREGLARTAVPFRLLDGNGQVIESSLLQVTSESVLIDSVVVEQNMYSVKTLPLSELGLVTGTPAEGYEIKTVTITPAEVTAAGKADNLAVLDTLYADSTVSVEGATESVTEQIRVRKPSELTYLSSDSITVAVEVGPVIRGKTFSDLKVNVTGLSDGLEASVLDGKAAVTINGPLLWVERLRSNSLTLTCDASGLTAGIYSLPVICQVEGSEDQTFNVEVLPDTVQVEIRTK